MGGLRGLEPPRMRGPAMGALTIGRRGLVAGLGLTLTAAAPAPRRPRVAIRTDHGDITVELEPEKAPLTSVNFLRYVDAGKYDGGSFFRATHPAGAPRDGTIVAAPSPRIHPFPPIAHESTTATGLRHVAGAVSLGRFAPGTATADFFICVSAQPYLDAHPGAPGDDLGFAVFGRVVRGLEVVRRIHALPTNGASPFADQKGQWLARPVSISHAMRSA